MTKKHNKFENAFDQNTTDSLQGNYMTSFNTGKKNNRQREEKTEILKLGRVHNFRVFLEPTFCKQASHLAKF